MSHSIRFAVGLATIGAIISATTPLRAATATFEDITLSGDFDNGDPGSLSPGDSHDGSFTSGGLGFNNQFDQGDGFIFWSGWSTSKVTDTTTPGFLNEFAAYHLPAGTGDGSSQYGVAFGTGSFSLTPTITAPTGEVFQSMRITNTTFAALSMRDGDGFAKKFGTDSEGNGEDFPDFFKLIITGLQGGVGGSEVGSMDFFLADYRFADNNQDYIIDQWTSVDLTPLVGADTLTFDFESSDSHPTFGVNTPAYFAADNIVTTVPEPGSVMLFLMSIIFSIGRIRQHRTLGGRVRG